MKTLCCDIFGVLLSPFNSGQRIVAKLLYLMMIIGLIGMLILSILGASHQSFHIIDITTGVANRVYDGVSIMVMGGLFVLLGMYYIRISDKVSKEEK